MTKTLTPKQEDFLEALLGEARGNIRAAMDIAGYSRTTKTAEVVGPLKEEITERAGMMLAMNAPKAAFGQAPSQRSSVISKIVANLCDFNDQFSHVFAVQKSNKRVWRVF